MGAPDPEWVCSFPNKPACTLGVRALRTAGPARGTVAKMAHGVQRAMPRRDVGVTHATNHVPRLLFDNSTSSGPQHRLRGGPVHSPAE